MPERFEPHLHGRRQRRAPAGVIHRALLGSLERFIGILIEHYAGAFPFWLAPVQVRVLPVGEDPSRGGAVACGRVCAATGSRSTTSDETVGKRIRAAELDKIPFVVVYGDREQRRGSLAIREHGGGRSTLSLAELAQIAC